MIGKINRAERNHPVLKNDTFSSSNHLTSFFAMSSVHEFQPMPPDVPSYALEADVLPPGTCDEPPPGYLFCITLTKLYA